MNEMEWFFWGHLGEFLKDKLCDHSFDPKKAKEMNSAEEIQQYWTKCNSFDFEFIPSSIKTSYRLRVICHPNDPDNESVCERDFSKLTDDFVSYLVKNRFIELT